MGAVRNVLPRLTVRGAVGINISADDTVGLSLLPRAATERPLLVRGVAGQTANLAEFQNSAGTPLAGVAASGDLFTTSSNRVQFRGVVIGGALPAYAFTIAVLIDGVQYRIPVHQNA